LYSLIYLALSHSPQHVIGLLVRFRSGGRALTPVTQAKLFLGTDQAFVGGVMLTGRSHQRATVESKSKSKRLRGIPLKLLLLLQPFYGLRPPGLCPGLPGWAGIKKVKPGR